MFRLLLQIRPFTEEINGKAVILTTGGFSADRNEDASLLHEFAGDKVCSVLQHSRIFVAKVVELFSFSAALSDH